MTYALRRIDSQWAEEINAFYARNIGAILLRWAANNHVMQSPEKASSLQAATAAHAKDPVTIEVKVTERPKHMPSHCNSYNWYLLGEY